MTESDSLVDRLLMRSSKMGYYEESLSLCSSTATADVLAALLEKESSSIPNNYWAPITATGWLERSREQARWTRLKALAAASGHGKNRKALPALRAMIDKGGLALEAAEVPIGEIGDPQDLEDFLQRLKVNPKLKLQLQAFGAMAIDRIMRELNDPSVPQNQKARIRGGLESHHRS
jgi:hypothetical protein